MTSPFCVSPAGLGIITASTPLDITQCAIVCSTYCSVLPVKIGRVGSAWKKRRRDADLDAIARLHHIAAANSRSKSAAVHGRGLVWWQMSAVGDLDQARDRLAL